MPVRCQAPGALLCTERVPCLRRATLGWRVRHRKANVLQVVTVHELHLLPSSVPSASLEGRGLLPLLKDEQRGAWEVPVPPGGHSQCAEPGSQSCMLVRSPSCDFLREEEIGTDG